MSADALAMRRPVSGAAIWPHGANAALGLWLATAPATFAPHHAGLLWSDVASGALIVAFSALACAPRFARAAWASALVGLWLMVAPLVFWAPTAAAYATDTFVGALVVAFSVLVPGTIGARDVPGPDAPPGWSYNPSAWPQRAPIVALALVQFFIARHLAAYQLRHVADPWDPVFGEGTRRVLDSDVSKAFPVSDAGLGAFTYLLEALAGLLGGTRRWRTMPWAVLLFGVLVVPVGVVSIVLVMLQPLAVGAWCSLCLVTAIITVFMISPAVDETVATGQFLLLARREGRPFWRTVWHGGEAEPASAAPPPGDRLPLGHQLAGGMELRAIPWNLALCAGVGVWLVVSPAVLGNTGVAATNCTLVGALVVTFAVIGFGEPSRAARLANVLFGLWLLASPLILRDGMPDIRWPESVAGAAVILLSLRRGPVVERFGSWDRYII
jgi:uncharacterized membrane protein